MELSEEEKKAIEIIKEEITRPNETALEVYVTDIKMLLHLIEKQQEKIKELTAFYNSFESGKIVNYPIFKQRYISKDKIRKTIKDLEKHRIMSSDDFTIKVLKELLKESNND